MIKVTEIKINALTTTHAIQITPGVVEWFKENPDKKMIFYFGKKDIPMIQADVPNDMDIDEAIRRIQDERERESWTYWAED